MAKSKAKKPTQKSKGWALQRARWLLHMLFELNGLTKVKETREQSAKRGELARKQFVRLAWWVADPQSPFDLVNRPSLATTDLRTLPSFRDNEAGSWAKVLGDYVKAYKFFRVDRSTRQAVKGREPLAKNKKFVEPSPGGRGYVPYIAVAMYSVFSEAEEGGDLYDELVSFSNISRVTRVQSVFEFDYNQFVEETAQGLNVKTTDAPAHYVAAFIVDVVIKHPQAGKRKVTP